jgi:hypothetical protein
MSKKSSLKNWGILALLLIFFGSPFFLAQWFFYHKGAAVPAELGTVNHGQLIQPPVILDQVLNIPPTHLKLKKHWYILYISNSENEKQINQALDKIYRIRLALGKEFSHVGELFGTPKSNALTSNPLKIHSFILSPQGTEKLLSFLKAPQGIFLMDTSKNIFMVYPENVNSDDIYKDIRRLISNQ